MGGTDDAFVTSDMLEPSYEYNADDDDDEVPVDEASMMTNDDEDAMKGSDNEEDMMRRSIMDEDVINTDTMISNDENTDTTMNDGLNTDNSSMTGDDDPFDGYLGSREMSRREQMDVMEREGAHKSIGLAGHPLGHPIIQPLGHPRRGGIRFIVIKHKRNSSLTNSTNSNDTDVGPPMDDAMERGMFNLFAGLIETMFQPPSRVESPKSRYSREANEAEAATHNELDTAITHHVEKKKHVVQAVKDEPDDIVVEDMSDASMLNSDTKDNDTQDINNTVSKQKRDSIEGVMDRMDGLGAPKGAKKIVEDDFADDTSMGNSELDEVSDADKYI